VEKIFIPELENFIEKLSVGGHKLSATRKQNLTQAASVEQPADNQWKQAFREHFKLSLSTCLREKLSAAECFGLIWEETLRQYRLSEREQVEVYHDLIQWARNASPTELYTFIPQGLLAEFEEEIKDSIVKKAQ
jgi:hypothetical protein